MTCLLDTHALLWSLQRPDLIGEAARHLIRGADANTILVSPVSAYEVAYKVARGRWPEAERLAHHFEQALEDTGFQLTPMTVSAAVRAGRLPDAHRDPFDRLLAATAIELDVVLLSADAALDGFGVRRVW